MQKNTFQNRDRKNTVQEYPKNKTPQNRAQNQAVSFQIQNFQPQLFLSKSEIVFGTLSSSLFIVRCKRFT